MISPLQPALTEEQRQAVEVKAGAYLLVAPPGSGKTEVLVQRVIWLLKTSPGEVFRVLALTFTNKAAEALRKRVMAVAGEEEWRVTAATFHAFCFEMLQNYGEAVGIAPDVTVYENDEDRSEALLRGIIDDGLPVPSAVEPEGLRGVLARIDRLRVDLVPPDQAPDVHIADLEISLRDAYEAYDHALRTFNAIDFNGILFAAYQLLTTDAWVAEHYRRVYRYLLVDEAQDTNLAQYELVRSLCGEELRNVYMAADENQSIFAFTGASPRFVKRFEREFGATKLYLTKNFRSAEVIVAVAGNLAQHFRGASGPRSPMVSAAAARGYVEARTFVDESSEGAGVADWITHALATGLDADWLYAGESRQLRPEDVAVIGRTRYAFDHLLTNFQDSGVGYALRTQEGGLFDSVLGQSIFFGLRVVANPRDVPSRRRLATLYSHDVALDPEELEAPRAFFRRLEPAGFPSQACPILASAEIFPQKADEVIAALVSLPSLAFVGNEQEADLWAKDAQQLVARWRNYAITTRPSERSVVGFLRSLNRLQRTTVDDPGIRVLTAHRAKGLEFRLVVILGLNEGTFPFYRSLGSDEEVDEERRSLYVAVTRAGRGLLLTRATHQQTIYGTWRTQAPSRFLAEMGVETRR